MSVVMFELAVGNIRSTPRMTKKQEQAAVEALFDFANGAELVFGNEIDHLRLRRIWKATARRHGYKRTYGCRAGSESVVSVKRDDWPVRRNLVRWLSAGVDHVTPRRTVVEVELQLKPTTLWLHTLLTHLVSEWQAYAKPKAGKTWRLRAGIAARSRGRLKKRAVAAVDAGAMPLLVGDLNALTNVVIAPGQRQILGTRNAGGNLGKMLQAACFPPAGVSVGVSHVRRHAPVATDHPYRAATLTVVTR